MSEHLNEILHHLGPYLPTDRFRAFAQGKDLPQHSRGAILIADISGYTPLTGKLVRQYGAQRASEELQKRINPMFEALAGTVFHKGGSVIRFLGDGFLAWFDESFPQEVPHTVNAAARAAVAAFDMMNLMQIFRDLELRVAIGYGEASRWVIGASEWGLVDLVVGPAVNDATHAAQPYKEPGVVMSVAAVSHIFEYPEIGVEVLPRGECRIRDIHGDLFDKVRAYRWSPWSVTADLQTVVNKVSRFVPPVIQSQIKRGLVTYVNELRYATPMFLQFGGIDYNNDPDAQQQLDAYLKDVQEIISETGGQLISVELSDKGSVIYIVHGAPISFRNDAVRAIQAALKIQNMRRRHKSIEWQRMGISRGLLYAGTVGGEVRHEYTLIGDSTNLAARLMIAAQPNQILVTAHVQQEADDDFDWQPLPAVTVKGRDGLVEVAEPLRRRYDTKVVRRFGRLVGREKEIERFQRYLNTAQERRPQIVRITGQNGVGKSYMSAEFLNLAAAQGFRTTHGACLSLGNQIPFLPWRSVIRDLLNLHPGWDEATKIKGIQAFLADYFPGLQSRWVLFADLLDLPLPDDELITMGDRHLKAIEAAVIDLIWAIAETQPIAISIEDTHWLDEVSENLLVEIIKEMNIQPAPVLLMLVHRPEEDIPHPTRILETLRNQVLHHHFALGEINEEAVGEIITERMGCPSPPELTKFIYEKTRGNTFFVQEMVDTLRETKAVMVYGKTVFIERDLQTIDLPRTVVEMTQARIDSLDDSERMILKVAAVIGGQFKEDLLARSLPLSLSLAELMQLLNELVKREFLQREPETGLLAFKHVLMQESTYNGMLLRQRQELHQIVGLALEDLEPESWEKLAYHFYNTTDKNRALKYLLKAGDEAYRAATNQAALRYYEQALTLMRDNELIFSTIANQLRLLFRMGDLERVKPAIEKLEALWHKDESRIDWKALLGSFQARYKYLISAWQEAIAEAEQVLAYAQPQHDLQLMWHSYEVLRDTYRQLNHGQMVELITTQMQQVAAEMDDPFRTMQLLLDDLESLHTRFPEQAQLGLENAYTEIKNLNSMAIEGKFWSVMARIHQARQDFPAALDAYQKQVDLWQKIGNQRLEGHALNGIGLLLLQLGQLSEGNNYLQWAYRLLHQVDEKSGEANSLASLGILAQRYQAYGEATAYLSRSLVEFEKLNYTADMARISFLLGNVALSENQLDVAQSYFARAIEISEQREDTMTYAEYQLGLAHYAVLIEDMALADSASQPALEVLLARFPYQWIDLGLAYWRLIGILRLLERHEDANEIFELFRNFIHRTGSSLDSEIANRYLVERIPYHQDLIATEGHPKLV